jgi:hypothetical protein
VALLEGLSSGAIVVTVAKRTMATLRERGATEPPESQ